MATKSKPRRVRASRLDQEQRRAELLQCAIRVFARRGLGGGRHAEIASEAGVSVPTVFFYFPTREALVRAVLEEVARFLTVMADEIHASDLPPTDVVMRHARTFVNSVDTHPHYARVWLDWSTAIREEVWPLYLEFQERMVALIARTIARGADGNERRRATDAEDNARLIVGSAHMLAQMKFARMPPGKVDHFLQILIHDTIG